MSMKKMFEKDPHIIARARLAVAEVLGTDHKIVQDVAFRRHVLGEPIETTADMELLVAFEAAVLAQENLLSETQLLAQKRVGEEQE